MASGDSPFPTWIRVVQNSTEVKFINSDIQIAFFLDFLAQPSKRIVGHLVSSGNVLFKMGDHFGATGSRKIVMRLMLTLLDHLPWLWVFLQEPVWHF